MNYEIAKKLKDAGYPLKKAENTHYDVFVSPTLSELIEACGDELLNIEHVLNGGLDGKEKLWWASGRNDGRAGETVDESVAEFWLALQSRK